MDKAVLKQVKTTRIDLKPDVRKKVGVILQQALADSSDLAMQAKTAHWNVKGSDFISLHKLFDDLYTEMAEHVDTIAERLAALGGTVYGRVQDAAKSTRLSPYPIDGAADGMGHVKALAEAYSTFGNELRDDIDQCEDLGDKVTGDVLNAITASLDKNIWFLEAHLR
jgi:starvation-inducible DNA-binding protein